MKWMSIIISVFAVQSIMAGAAFVDFELGLVFPQQLGGMDYDKVEKFNTEELGYSVFYEREDHFRAEVSIYNLGRKTIDSGPKVDGVEMILQGMELELERKEEDLLFNVQRRGSLVVPSKGDIQLANTVFQYSEPRDVRGKQKKIPRYLSVYITGAHNNFVKVLFSFDVAQNKPARAMSAKLVQQLVEMLKSGLSEEQLMLAACEAAVYDPGGYGGKAAAQRVFTKAQTMGELAVYDAFFVWSEDYSAPKNSDLLTAAYFAGMLQVVLPKKQDVGGDYEAFVAMVQAYENMRKRDQITAIQQLDEWVKATDKKVLYQKLLIDFGYVLKSE